jgi:hypothetical protein
MRRYLIALAVIVVALAATVWLPFVNSTTLWFGLPSVMVWTVIWVVAITPVLAGLEFSGRYRDSDDSDTRDRDSDRREAAAASTATTREAQS